MLQILQAIPLHPASSEETKPTGLSQKSWQPTSQFYHTNGQTINDFLQRFSPAVQFAICADIRQCHLGDYPRMSEVNLAYGSQASVAWLIPQLHNLSEFVGAKEKLRNESLKECAVIIANEYGRLRISELMLFFYRFKTGHYGRFYGNVDPVIIIDALRQFVRERNDFIDRLEREEYWKKLEEDRQKSCTYEEYLRMTGTSPNPFLSHLLS